MLEIEHDLREQYDDAQIEADDPADEAEDGPADSRLDEYTGRVLDFEREELREDVKATRPASKIRLRILCHDGETRTETIQWPFDPTDKREPLVRLCKHVGVPIDRVAELQGKYVPMETHDEGPPTLEIPPIPALGNNLLYRFKRLQRTNAAVRHGTDALVVGTAALAWVPAYKLFFYLPVSTMSESIVMGLLIGAGLLLSALTAVVSGLVFTALVVAVLWVSAEIVAKKVSSTLFPKA